jgi:hypothetical protein
MNSEIRPPEFLKGLRPVKHKTYRISLVTLTFLLGSLAAFAQEIIPQNILGTYEGMVKRPDATAEEKVSIELKNEGGKLTGRANHGDKSMVATDAKFENGMLTLVFDKDHKFVGKIDGDKLSGEVSDATHKFPLELKKVTTAAVAAPAPAAEPTTAAGRGAVDLNGQWEGVADANGQPFNFLLTLKVDGENVTGGSSSQLGDSQIKSGTWKDGKLVFQLEGQNGIISMSAAIVEGKLSGDFDYAGQLQGRWVAVKKN